MHVQSRDYSWYKQCENRRLTTTIYKIRNELWAAKTYVYICIYIHIYDIYVYNNIIYISRNFTHTHTRTRANTHRSATAAGWSNTFGLLLFHSFLLFLPFSMSPFYLFSFFFAFLPLAFYLICVHVHKYTHTNTHTHTQPRTHHTQYTRTRTCDQHLYLTYITRLFFLFAHMSLSYHCARKNWENICT